jgi:Kdo2-lipid IVA lauroyltransferase/acyltransferase
VPQWVYNLRNAPLRGLTRLALFCIGLLPPRLGYRFGRGLALSVWALFPGWRRTTLRNIELFFGDALDASQRQALGRQAAEQFGYHIIDFVFTTRRSGEQTTQLLGAVQGLEHYQTALAAGGGAIMLGLHLGSWELSCLALKDIEARVLVLVKEQRDPFFSRLQLPLFEKFGVRRLPVTRRALAEVVQALRGNEVLWLAADQNGGSTGVFVPFCGRLASTAPGAAAFALKTGAPLLLTYVVRQSPGVSQIHVEPPLDVSGLPEDRKAAELELLRRINVAYERVIRDYPAQWLWGHKRWKTRPPGEAPLY